MPKVLIVEDDLDVCQTLKQTLLSLNYDVATSSNLDEAIAAIRKEDRFDAILADFWLNGASVVPFLDEVKRQSGPASIIIISGGGGEISIEMTKAIGEISGAVRFLQKPFRRSEIEEILRELVAP